MYFKEQSKENYLAAQFCGIFCEGNVELNKKSLKTVNVIIKLLFSSKESLHKNTFAI